MKDKLSVRFKYEDWNSQVAKWGIFAYTAENVYTEVHLHSQVELDIVERGKVLFTVDGNELVIEEGNGVLILPHTIHTMHRVGIDCSVSTFIFGTDFLLDFMSFLESANTPFVLLDKTRCPQFALAQVPYLLEFSHKYNVGKTVVKALLSALLSGMMPAYSGGKLPKRSEKLSSYQMCRKLLTYVDENISSDLTLNSIAKALNIVPCYVSSVFSNNFGVTLNYYITTKRIMMAKSLLVSTMKPISEIAYSCGFASIRSFNRRFKDYEGMTPSEYRESFMNPFADSEQDADITVRSSYSLIQDEIPVFEKKLAPVEAEPSHEAAVSEEEPVPVGDLSEN